MRLLLLGVGVMTLLLSSLFACAGEGSGSGAPMLFGVALDGQPISQKQLVLAAEETGLPVCLVNFFVQWPGEPAVGGFPLESLEAVTTFGAVPCVTWEPMYYASGEETMIPAEAILSGRYDSYIDGFAHAARQWGHPLLLRFAHEMNLSRYHWGTDVSGYGSNSPAVYREMYKYVVDRFRGAAASNVAFVFCPNAESVPNTSYDPNAGWNTVDAYWPGREYVDVLGMDGYNWGTTQTLEQHGWQSSFRSFADVFGPMHQTLRVLAQDLPLVVFETASVTQGGDKTAWIKEALVTARQWHLAGLVWFHVAKEQDWRMHTGSGHPQIKELLPHMYAGSAPAQLLGLQGAKP